MTYAYYNEFEPYAAQWLRNLIALKFLPAGIVDERSITDVRADEIREFTQCHFFAGIGGWPIALGLAKWPEDRPVWTGSCPCQPFSVAGQQKAQNDERHLWPIWFNLIRQCCPATVFGEQVSGAIAHGWLDDVYKGLEGEGYAVGSAVLPACSVGAPHRRDRLWFGGVRYRPDTASIGCNENGPRELIAPDQKTINVGNSGYACGRQRGIQEYTEDRRPMGGGSSGESFGTSKNVSFAESQRHQCGKHQNQISPQQTFNIARENQGLWQPIFSDDRGAQSMANTPSEGSFSATLTGLYCGEEAARPRGERFERYNWWNVEPPVGRVANGIYSRVGRLRAYGNAIVPQVAAEFIAAFMEARP